jgi:hypothetical protein
MPSLRGPGPLHAPVPARELGDVKRSWKVFGQIPIGLELVHGVDLVLVGKAVCTGPRRRGVVALNGLEMPLRWDADAGVPSSHLVPMSMGENMIQPVSFLRYYFI